jgi:hypothetical protein
MESLSLALLLGHVGATLYMTGLIWFVQRVHYPLLAGVGPLGFHEYEQAHVARTTTVVGPPMLVEAGSAAALVVYPPAAVPPTLAWIGLLLLGIVWLSTWLQQVPCHRELEHGFEARAHARLVSTNWIRTAAWSLRGLLVLWMVYFVAARPT